VPWWDGEGNAPAFDWVEKGYQFGGWDVEWGLRAEVWCLMSDVWSKMSEGWGLRAESWSLKNDGILERVVSMIVMQHAHFF
jgi:hypothetical protein